MPGAISEMVKDSTAYRRCYQEDGFYLHDQPLFSPELIERACLGMDAIRDGQYDTGRPPCGGKWKPGDDPEQALQDREPAVGSFATSGEFLEAARWANRSPRPPVPDVQIWRVQLLYKPPAVLTAGCPPTAVAGKLRSPILGRLGRRQRIAHRLGRPERRPRGVRTDAVRPRLPPLGLSQYR